MFLASDAEDAGSTPSHMWITSEGKLSRQNRQNYVAFFQNHPDVETTCFRGHQAHSWHHLEKFRTASEPSVCEDNPVMGAISHGRTLKYVEGEFRVICTSMRCDNGLTILLQYAGLHYDWLQIINTVQMHHEWIYY